MGKLTPRMRRFVTEYLVDLNATQAAIRAGYSANGASVTGCRLLADPKIRTLIEARNEKRAERVGLTADGVLEGIKRLSEKAENSGDLNVAMKGHELYGKHLKLFTDKVQHEGTVNIAVINPYAKTKGEDR